LGRSRKIAAETAGRPLKRLRIAERIKLDMVIEDGKVSNYPAKLIFRLRNTGKNRF